MNTGLLKTKKIPRQSNIELCRIASIMLVVMVHATFASLGWPSKMSDTTIPTIFSESLAICGVNVFVIITGWFSATPKKKSIINLVYICFFYAFWAFCIQLYTNQVTYKSFFFISKSNWFIMDYIGLLLLTPILNVFIEKVDRKYLLRTIIVLFIYQMWFGFLPGYNMDFNNGYSILSFIQLYLIARYFKLYGCPAFLVRNSFLIYILSCIGITAMAIFVLSLGFKPDIIIQKVFGYNNPLIILSAFCFFYTFLKMEIGYVRWINYISQSCLGVLLVHQGNLLFPFMKEYFTYNADKLSFISIIGGGILGILVIFVIGVVVDQLRIYSYKVILKIIK